jgi:predicted Fe-Mo cluster-binding NifX family protein
MTDQSQVSLKIAAVTEDGQAISSHFGMAPAYRVYTVTAGQVTGQEDRTKPHHTHHPEHNGQHAQEPHPDMFAPVQDCQALLCGGMGEPAYRKALAAGLQVVLVGGSIDAAVTSFLSGDLQSDLRRIHQH